MAKIAASIVAEKVVCPLSGRAEIDTDEGQRQVMARGPSGGMRFAAAAILGLVASFIPAAAEIYAATMLRPASTLRQPTDLLVVLGGETHARAAAAARLYAKGLAPTVLVTGAGDCVENIEALLRGGVPAQAIRLDCQAQSTWENARSASRTAKLLNARRVVVVTSWFHLPRAMMCFGWAMPGISLFAEGVYEQPLDLWSLDTVERLGSEYVKAGWYLLRFGAAALAFSLDQQAIESAPRAAASAAAT